MQAGMTSKKENEKQQKKVNKNFMQKGKDQ